MSITQFPDCQSPNIKYFDARKSYTCMDCGFSFSEKEFNKLRIFLSYGHDHNEELVRLIKTNLEKFTETIPTEENDESCYIVGEFDVLSDLLTHKRIDEHIIGMLNKDIYLYEQLFGSMEKRCQKILEYSINSTNLIFKIS